MYAWYTNPFYLVSPLSLFKNPMILLAVFAMVVMFAMPKLMENSTSLFLLFSPIHPSIHPFLSYPRMETGYTNS